MQHDQQQRTQVAEHSSKAAAARQQQAQNGYAAPYAAGNALVSAPISVLLKPRDASWSITGAEYVSVPRLRYLRMQVHIRADG
jgi:hypothetical protein